MRLPILALAALAALLGCRSMDPADARARDFDWLAGLWIGRTQDGDEVRQEWTPPADGALQGEHRVIRGDKVIVFGSMRIVSGINGAALLGTLEGEPARRFGLVEFAPRHALFRARTSDYPSQIEFSRTGSSMTVRVRGSVGLGLIRETAHELRLQTR